MSELTTTAHEALDRLITADTKNGLQTAPLLDQLKAAIFNGMETGGSASFGSKMPLAVTAYDLYTRIEDESAALIVGAPRYLSRAGREEGLWGQFGIWDRYIDQNLPTPLTEDAVNAFSVKKWRFAFASPAENITAWIETLQSDFQAEIASRIITRWVDSILRLLYPESKREFMGKCPECHERWFYDVATNSRSAAVIITFPEGIARSDCRACPARWVGAYDVIDMKFKSELHDLIDNDSQND